MIDNQPVLTIHRGHRRPGHTLIEAFRGASTSHLADAMNGRGSLDWRIKPLDPANARFVGAALTAHSYPADIHGMVGAAMEAEAGDVICCANDGFTGTAVIGDLAAGILRNKRVAAFVTDGLARDRAGIAATGLPLFAVGERTAAAARGIGFENVMTANGDATRLRDLVLKSVKAKALKKTSPLLYLAGAGAGR